jgi:hypothetical protein
MRAGMRFSSYHHRLSRDWYGRLRPGDDADIGAKANLPHELIGLFQIAGIIAYKQSFDILEDPELLGVESLRQRVQLTVVTRKNGSRPGWVGVDYLIILGHPPAPPTLLDYFINTTAAAIS